VRCTFWTAIDAGRPQPVRKGETTNYKTVRNFTSCHSPSIHHISAYVYFIS